VVLHGGQGAITELDKLLMTGSSQKATAKKLGKDSCQKGDSSILSQISPAKLSQSHHAATQQLQNQLPGIVHEQEGNAIAIQNVSLWQRLIILSVKEVLIC
jgi:hypothetical protein